MARYRFKKWEDGSTGLEREFVLNANKEVTAYYEKVIDVANVRFSGLVSKHPSDTSTTPVTVNLKVTRPDGVDDAFSIQTDNAGVFMTVKEYLLPGQYSVQATVPASTIYALATSPVVSFTTSQLTRTVTLNVDIV